MSESQHMQNYRQAAQVALQNFIPKTQADPWRPRFHFTAPAGWMNDPNGTIYHHPYYHLFYQHNPFRDDWGHIAWGHARSKDLLHWEHLPIALLPENDGVEQGVWSGCVAFNGEGQPLAFYTRSNYPQHLTAPLVCEVSVAIGDAEMINWEKWDQNPLLSRMEHAPQFRPEWRDPFIFHHQGRSYMVVGMCGRGTPLFEALDDSLLRWKMHGMLCDIDAECPNFFQLQGGKWVFLSSPFNSVEFALGEFAPQEHRFIIEERGRYDWSEFGHSNYYATNHLYAPDGRSIVFGWVRGWDAGRGWNGCMGIPRDMRLDAEGILRSTPISEFEQLRGEMLHQPGQSIEEGISLLPFEYGDQCEVRAALHLGKASKAGLHMLCSEDGVVGASLWLAADGVHLDGVHIPLDANTVAAGVDLRLFIDRSVLELFVNDGQYCAIRVVKNYRPGNRKLVLYARGGRAHIDNLKIWQIKGI